MLPETRYARSGDVHIAYQVLGDGPIDLVIAPGWISHLEYDWEYPPFARFHQRLASFARLIRFDKRGTGLSDRGSITELPTLEQRMDDMRAVMDAVGSERAVLMGASEGGPLSILFAATYPKRTTALILYAAFGRGAASSEYPWAFAPADPAGRERFFARITKGWGTAEDALDWSPSSDEDPFFRVWWSTRRRLGASPGAALALLRMNAEIDVRHALPAIHVPTLIMHRSGDQVIPVGNSRYLAEHIAGARYVELPGIDHMHWVGNQDEFLDEIEAFLMAPHSASPPDRVLATVLHVDIEWASGQATKARDRSRHVLVQEFHALVRRELAHFRGVAVRLTDDGILATFDGAARAVRFASVIRDAAQQRGLTIRAGLHTGEVEVAAGEARGVAVRVSGAVAGEAGPNEVLVSSTVRDQVGDSGLTLEPRSTLSIPGVDLELQLFVLRPSRQDEAVVLTASTAAPHLGSDGGPTEVRRHVLTQREREVAILVGKGYTNRRIGEALVIAEKTAEVHARNIREKLGLDTRAQIAAWVAQHGLLTSDA